MPSDEGRGRAAQPDSPARRDAARSTRGDRAGGERPTGEWAAAERPTGAARHGGDADPDADHPEQSSRHPEQSSRGAFDPDLLQPRRRPTRRQADAPTIPPRPEGPLQPAPRARGSRSRGDGSVIRVDAADARYAATGDEPTPPPRDADRVEAPPPASRREPGRPERPRPPRRDSSRAPVRPEARYEAPRDHATPPDPARPWVPSVPAGTPPARIPPPTPPEPPPSEPATDTATHHFRRRDWEAVPDGGGGAGAPGAGDGAAGGRPAAARRRSSQIRSGRSGTGSGRVDETVILPPARPARQGRGGARRSEADRQEARGGGRGPGAPGERPGRGRAQQHRAGSGRVRPAAAGGSITGVLPVTDPVRDGRAGGLRSQAGPPSDTGPLHRAADWIVDHWGAGPGRSRHLPVILVAVAAVLAAVAWLLGPAQHDQASVDATGATQTPPVATSPTVPPASSAVVPGSDAVGSGTDGGGPAGPVSRAERAATSGLFPSGVAAHTVAEVNAWARFRDRPVDVVVTYTGRDSWNAIVNPWIGRSASTFSNFAGDWVVSVPLFPDEGSEAGNLMDCAAGDYDGKWRQFGRWLVSQGRGDSFVRLGWEFNGDWFAWRASTNPPAYVQCFRNASAAIKAASPEVRIDWNLNAHGPREGFAHYPGDQYVDVIGIDSYDQYPPSLTVADFETQCHADEGLCQVIEFARRHNKLFSVPEWGVVSSQNTKAGAVGAAGGDNPVYIEQMYSMFQRNADILAYEAYFSDDVPGNVHSSLINPARHPRAAEAYKRLW